jgi:hypothetical protein
MKAVCRKFVGFAKDEPSQKSKMQDLSTDTGYPL